jgi:subfamily B ATP-binding cassette protein MsbA
MRKLSGNTQEQVGLLTSFLSEIFRAIPIVKLYQQEKFETNRAHAVINQVFQLTYKAIRVRSSSHPITEILGGAAVLLGITYGGWQVIHGQQTTGTFISFIAALIMAYEPVKKLANLNANLQEGVAAADRLFKLMDTPVQIQDRPGAVPFLPHQGEIIFEHVQFSYTPDQPVIHDLSLKIPGGKVTALVGPSGGGKTTVLQLIPRFYETQSGTIYIDGQDIAHCQLSSLRQHIAVVSQDITLFRGTIRHNIAYGYPDTDLDVIIKCAQDAAAHEFIMALPQQYDTILGEHGVGLSGGQRQRLAIARALFKNAPILLLDEATSALDAHSEQQVQRALRHLMHQRTTLVVAHRLATIQNADHICVIHQGQVVEQGTHTSLLSQNGFYTKLYQQYTEQEEQS